MKTVYIKDGDIFTITTETRKEFLGKVTKYKELRGKNVREIFKTEKEALLFLKINYGEIEKIIR